MKNKIHFSLKSGALVLLLWAAPIVMFAQSITVNGRVTYEDNEPIIGATVVVKGGNAQHGTITDVDGKYTLSNVPSNGTLNFSSVGMGAKEEAVKGRKEINVVLSEDSQLLDEVVVTAMGIQRDRKSLGYAISTIKADDLNVAGVAINPVQSLYGKAAGVAVRQSASGPLGGININIRGNAGLDKDANTRPLFVVDGVPIFDENTSMTNGKTDFGTGINDINSEDISSIEILKGAKASVLYGSQGANGVVLINTKSGAGAVGKAHVNVSFQYSFEQPRIFTEFQNKYGGGGNIYDVNSIIPGQVYPRFKETASSFGPAFDPSQKRIWWDGVARPYASQDNSYRFLFNNGHNMTTNASVEKAGDFGSFRFSYTNMDYKGVQENMGQKRNTVSLSSIMKFSKQFSMETVANLYSIKTTNRSTDMLDFFVRGITRDAPFREFIQSDDYIYTDPDNPNYGYKKDLSEATGEGYASDGVSYYSLRNYSNYVWNRRNNNDYDNKLHLIATVRPTYRLTEWLTLSGQASLDYTDTDFITKNGVERVSPQLQGGKYAFAKRNTKIQDYKAMINFVQSFVDNRLDVSAFIGTSYKKDAGDEIRVSTEGNPSGFTYPNWWSIDNQNNEKWPNAHEKDKVRSSKYGRNSLYAVFGVATVTWDRKYTLELNARNDWSSTLPPENNSYFYPGVAFTWDATELLQTLTPVIEFANLRASWADVGKDAPSRYFAYNTLESSTIEGTPALAVQSPSALFAGAIKPERKREYELGLNWHFFKNSRVRLDASFYTNNIYDQIMSVPLSKSTGAEEIKINAGDVKNWGYEIELSGTPILTKDFKWDVTFTTSNQFSEVKKLYPGITRKSVNGMSGKVDVVAIEKERVGNIYGTAMETDPYGNRVVAPAGDKYVLAPGEVTKIGNVFPDFMGGLGTTFSYKGISLYMHIDYSFGATMYSQTNQWMMANGASKESLKYRDQENGGLAYYVDRDTDAKIPWEHNKATPNGESLYHNGIMLSGVQKTTHDDGTITYAPNDVIGSVSSYYSGFVAWAGEAINATDVKFKNDYIKVRELALSYQLPRKLVNPLKLRTVSVSAFGRNLGYLHKTIPNLDPEAFMGTNDYFEASAIPSTRSFGFKIEVGF